MPKKEFDQTESEEVTEVFRTIQDVNIPVTLDFVHADVKVEGCQLELDAQQGVVVIKNEEGSELVPFATEGKGINLTAIVDGVKVTARRMRSRNTHLADGGEALVFDLPTMLLYSQRREVYRAQVDDYIDVPVSVHAANTFEDGQSAPLAIGMLTTISVLGCSLIFSSESCTDLADYELLTVLQMEIPDQPDFPILYAEVRNQRPDEVSGSTTLGFQFAENDKHARKLLGQLSTRMQLLARGSKVLSA